MAPIKCPNCDVGRLQTSHPSPARCPSCGRVPEGWVLETLGDIASLPTGAGTHACECGHPQMRRLPDGTFRCPSCGQEILSAEATLDLWEFREESAAYRQGWLDGYLAEVGNFASSARLARWEGACERLDYYRGHRAGSESCLLERVGSSDSVSPAGEPWRAALQTRPVSRTATRARRSPRTRRKNL